MSESLAPLLRSLQQAGIDLDVEGTLDSLWLALRMHERLPARTGATPSSTTTTSGTPLVDTPTAVRSSNGEQPRHSLPARTSQSARLPGPTAPSRAIALPRGTALPESRSLINALRPLRRRVVSPGTGVLDIDATVRRAAEEDLWIPSFESARERWLDVLLVADHGLSMVIWKDTIDEFERVLRVSGAFRSVRSWWLESDAARLVISPRGRGPHPAMAEQLTRLVRGQARSIVLVISDCVGARWHDGEVPRLLAKWAAHLPVALTQVTPEWFWARTALGDTVSCRFRSTMPAAVNRQFRIDALPSGLSDPSVSDAELFRLPAAPLTSVALARIAGLIAGASREWAPGVLFDLTWQGENEPAQAVSASERTTRFRALASKGAQRLAACYAASPVRTLGVLRLLRRDLLPEAGPFIEAEVLLGGILRVQKEKARWDLGASLPLEFFPDVQALLLDNAAAADVLRALEHAARVAQSGVVPTFTSWLEEPSSGVAQLDPGQSDFAAAAAASLAQLGGSFARLVRPSETISSDGSQTTVAAASVDPPAVAPNEFAQQHAEEPRAVDQPERREYLISGRVQGVGFRAFVQEQLTALGLEGIAENLRDGRIHVIVTGPVLQLGRLESRLRQGPPASKVDDVTVLREDVVGALETARGSSPHRPELRRGADGAAVVEVQRKLGVYPHDGFYDARTEAAVRQFQTARGLLANGIVGEATWKEIDAAPLPPRPASSRGGGRAVIAIGVDRVETLPTLRASASGARRFARWSLENQEIPSERVWLFTDEERRVGVTEIYDAIAACIQSGDLDQLIVYFAGHGAYIAQQDLWLLSDALLDLNAVISVEQNVQLARYSGIRHVVFISDTSRTAEVGVRMTGSLIFPNVPEHRNTAENRHVRPEVDRFFPAGPAQKAYEVEGELVFTRVLLSALSGSESSALTEHDGRKVVTSRSLVRFLEQAVPDRLVHYAIKSVDDCWLASF